MTSQPNILMLTVDALRADRTSLYGYDRPTTPTLERLAKEAVVCDRAFSLGTFTQSAAVQLFTSTPPLSFGGFDAGAVGRPDTLFKHFQDNGYRTTAISTLHWVNSFFGYGAGLDEEHQLFVPNTLVGVAIATMRNSLTGYYEGDISHDEMMAVVCPAIEKLFEDADDYFARRLEHEKSQARDYPHSLLVNEGYDLARVKRLIQGHRKKFEADRAKYVARYFAKVPASNEWLAADWRLCRPLRRLAGEAVFRFFNRILGMVKPNLASARSARFRQYVDAGALADKTIAELRNVQRDKPFLIWCHFMDTHVPYVSGHGRKWYRETSDYLQTLGYPATNDPALVFRDTRAQQPEIQKQSAALYDAAVRWTDEQIGRIIDVLDESGMGEDTIVMVCGDHGEELGDHGDLGHYFLLYEHNLRIPMIFRRKGMKPVRLSGLNTIQDVAPTLADMAGLPPADGWTGAPVDSASAAARETVVMETFYGGNCLFEHRPLYFAARGQRYKLIWSEARDPADKFSPDGPQLYDLTVDPGEHDNIYVPDHAALSGLEAAIATRMAEIPELSADRIVAAFGQTGRRAVATVRGNAA
ncbi:sulfatase-like hydrolase/transferase [bacterium]|jgi:arylsulfatase A-like enzyme|nr:sulfatase-like hydrolase/transferase [bacterium]